MEEELADQYPYDEFAVEDESIVKNANRRGAPPEDKRIAVTSEQVLQAVEARIAEKGDGYVYPKRPNREQGASYADCYYVWNGQADCIVGAALNQMGAPLEALGDYEGEGALVPITHLFNMPKNAKYALRKAQRMQDMSRPYGEVFVSFKEALENGPQHPFDANTRDKSSKTGETYIISEDTE